jgi:N-acetylmuramoyl-L-alanine amidase
MKPKLWIDAGHGFENTEAGKYDPGAVGLAHTEADVVLTVALSGRWILEMEFGIETWLTRDDDRDSSPVDSRDNRALAAGCNFGVALHMNANESARATGTEVFYRDTRDANWAKDAQRAALSAFGLRDRGLKPESKSQHPTLAVLNFTPPMCLLELGFITNKQDLKRILERDRRIAFWRAIGKALTSK